MLHPIAFLGIFGYLAEQGFSLPRNEAEDDTQQEAWEASAAAGTLVHIADLTKRSLYATIKAAVKSKRDLIQSFSALRKRAVEFSS